MNRIEFDALGQYIISDLRRAAGCHQRNCRTELYFEEHIQRAHLHHGARHSPDQLHTFIGDIAIIVDYNPAFGQTIIRAWRGHHGMVDLLPDRHALLTRLA